MTRCKRVITNELQSFVLEKGIRIEIKKEMSQRSAEQYLRTFAEYTKRLEVLAEVRTTDIGHRQNAEFINCFISKFTTERAYIVGSTAEHAKLSFDKDGGDADVIMVSGMLEIAADDLKHKTHNPCYVWVLANEKAILTELELVDNKYLSARLLRELRPELFTFLRAIHSNITACLDRLPDNDALRTIVSVPSKVGISSTCYVGLKLHGREQSRRRYNRQDALHRTDEQKWHLLRRLQTVEVHKQDIFLLRRIWKILRCAKHPGGRGEDNGLFAFFAQGVDDAISRPSLVREAAAMRKNSTSDNDILDDNDGSFRLKNDLNDNERPDDRHVDMKVTYRRKVHRDFVPALKVIGEIKYMQEWRKRVRDAGWAESKIDEICSTDIFVVSRIAPVNPNINKDFCLSFNLAELKLVKMMTTVQRRVYLILKAFLKGRFEQVHKSECKELKLKTYHIKTLLFWLYESYQYSVEEDTFETVHALLHAALDSLRAKLSERVLLHYFIPSNLFIEFEADDFRLLIECVDVVKTDPVNEMKYIIDLDDDKPVEKRVTPDELQTIIRMWKDGGRGGYIDKLEDAFIDVLRGMSLGKRDSEGRLPIREAVLDTLGLFLKDENHIDLQIFKQINNMIRAGFSPSDDPNFSAINKKIQDTCVFIEGLGLFVPQIKDLISTFGGRPVLQHMLEGALRGKPLNFDSDIGTQILETADRYLSCSDEDVDVVADELKYKLLGYFSGRTRYTHLSSLIF